MKVCTKCGNKYPATLEYFPSEKRCKNGLNSNCRICYRKYQRKYCHDNSTKRKEYQKKYCQTLKGYLRNIYGGINRRCNNPKCRAYEDYGGRGIKNKFESLDDFRDYIITNLGIIDINQIKGLHIDRINNNGNYEKGNVRFITQAENNRNNQR